MPASPLVRLRKLCLAFPEAHEVLAWNEPTFRVRNKLFAMYASKDTHHGNVRAAVWCKSTHSNQSLLLSAQAERYFKPPYVGPSGWVGAWLDGTTDWCELAGLLEDGYRLIAPRKLLAAMKPL